MRKIFSLVMSVIILTSIIVGIGYIHMTASSDQGVTLFFEPESINVEPGQIFTLNVNIANVQSLYKWTFKVQWDPAIMELEPASAFAVAEGTFMKSFGRTYFVVYPYTVRSGCVSYISCEFMQPASASGSGNLLTLSFKAVNRGNTTVTISDSVLYDYTRQIISHTCVSAQVSVDSTFRDLTVSLDSPSTLVLGESVLLNATVMNVGEADATGVDLAILINDNIVQYEQQSLLKVGSSCTISYNWTPSSSGEYNITAYATPILGEANTSNNFAVSLVKVVSMVHDLAVSLEAPTQLVVGENASIKVTITNVGAYDETNVQLETIINGVTINLTTVDLVVAGSSQFMTLLWQLPEEGKYNVTAYIHPVAKEISTVNNMKSLVIYVTSPSATSKILVVADDDGRYCYKGTSLSEFEQALQKAGYSYDVWKESVNGRPPLEELLRYKLVIWTCGDFCLRPVDSVDATTLTQYYMHGGNILIEGERIAYEASPDFRSSILHIDYFYDFGMLPSGLTVSLNHSITKGLSNITWEITPTHLDRLKPAYGAYDVMRFYGESAEFGPSYFNYTAVVVYDGIDTGSVIYYAFALFSLPQFERTLLVKQSVDWLLRFDLSKIGARLVNAPAMSAYFIYADPAFLTVNETFGMVAGATVYGVCKNPQFQGFNTTRNWVDGGRINSTEINDKMVVLTGNPNYHNIIKYYEDAGMTPVKFSENESYFMFVDPEGNIIASLSKEEVESGSKDAFVVYSFTDGNNEYLVMYGFGWKGTWEAGRFFADEFSKQFARYHQLYFISLVDYSP